MPGQGGEWSEQNRGIRLGTDRPQHLYYLVGIKSNETPFILAILTLESAIYSTIFSVIFHRIGHSSDLSELTDK